MADGLQVDPIGLHMASDHLVAAASEHAAETTQHRDDFADAVSRWRGAASSAALQEVTEAWQTRHAERQERMNEQGQHVTDAANRYTATDSAQGEVLESVPLLGTDSTNGPAAGQGL